MQHMKFKFSSLLIGGKMFGPGSKSLSGLQTSIISCLLFPLCLKHCCLFLTTDVSYILHNKMMIRETQIEASTSKLSGNYHLKWMSTCIYLYLLSAWEVTTATARCPCQTGSSGRRRGHHWRQHNRGWQPGASRTPGHGQWLYPRKMYKWCVCYFLLPDRAF